MSFVGILCAPKQETYIKQVLQEYMAPQNIMILREDSMENFKNITFETIAIFSGLENRFSNSSALQTIIEKAKYFVVSADEPIPLNRDTHTKRKCYYLRIQY